MSCRMKFIFITIEFGPRREQSVLPLERILYREIIITVCVDEVKVSNVKPVITYSNR